MSSENQRSKGRPTTPENEQLKPRFTLNLSDEDNATFEKAVILSGRKRSSLAREGVMTIANKILAPQNLDNEEPPV